ncbi:hypothetical protein ACFO1B_01345 [Dactylosporangium siamense]|nr:hypothetical protein [Dactylosporangium siamense]
MDFHAVQGSDTALAKLVQEPAELEARLGLTFLEVDSQLGPSLFAFGQLADGTVIGFNRLISLDRHPGTELYQYADRRPVDVVTELLFETGLSHDDVSWMTAPPLAEDERLWARSRAEADTYLRLQHPQGCPVDPVEVPVDGHTVLRCGDIEIYLRPPPDRHDPVPPSTITDPGSWLSVAFELDAAAAHREAAEAVREALRFLPPGADELPVRMFWTPLGLRMLRQHPGQFSRAALQARLAALEAAARQVEHAHGRSS